MRADRRRFVAMRGDIHNSIVNEVRMFVGR